MHDTNNWDPSWWVLGTKLRIQKSTCLMWRLCPRGVGPEEPLRTTRYQLEE